MVCKAEEELVLSYGDVLGQHVFADAHVNL